MAYGHERNVDDEHRALLDAAVMRDADCAAALLAAHYRETAQVIARILALPEGQAAA
jgi:DNA-binding GntR family transcriptional regulator